MSQQQIPTFADPFYSETVTLDGTPYVLTFRYNQRVAGWYLDLATIDGEVVAAGLKLVCEWDVLALVANPLRPPGALFVLSNTTDDSTPGLTDLAAGGRCFLVYTPAADLAALLAGAAP